MTPGKILIPSPRLEVARLARRMLAGRTEAKRKAEGRLVEFIRQGWRVLEPATPYVHGWHIDAMAEHLEAVSNGWVRKLIINVPPRHMKSLCLVFWTCWDWTRRPERRWLYSSYAQRLSTRDSLKCRRLMQSRWYQSNWGGVFRLTSDQNEKTRFDNDRMGYRLATSVDGANTGEGGDILVYDDPHNVRERESDVQRENVITWKSEVMSSRLNDPNTGAEVLVMQRVHERDLSGFLLEQGGWEHLCLPARYEA